MNTDGALFVCIFLETGQIGRACIPEPSFLIVIPYDNHREFVIVPKEGRSYNKLRSNAT